MLFVFAAAAMRAAAFAGYRGHRAAGGEGPMADVTSWNQGLQVAGSTLPFNVLHCLQQASLVIEANGA